VTFKPNTDDIRDAPSIAIIQVFLDHGAVVRVYDPKGMDPTRREIDNVEFGADAYDVAAGADCIVLVTEWNEFRSLDLRQMRNSMRTRCFVVLRNVYRRHEVESAGLRYFSVGRATSGKTDLSVDAE
jgi:UDPglucose 6-dehydrogenase